MPTLAGTPASNAAPPPPARRTMSRADIVALGRAGRPWEFAPIALQALRVAPQDAEIRFLAAAGFAQLGLVTIAREHLSSMPAQLASDPSVAALTQAIAALPSDLIPLDTLVARVRANLAALAARGLNLEHHLDAWIARARQDQWFNARGGNIVRRRLADPGSLLRLADHRAAAGQFVQHHLATRPPVIYLEGIDPPWILQAADATLQRAKDGFFPRLVVMQQDPLELLDGLAHTDLSAALAAPRLALFTGPDASARFAADLAARISTRLTGPYAPLLSLRTRSTPPMHEVLAAGLEAQAQEMHCLSELVAARYASRGAAYWSARYDEATAPGSRAPLRVMIITSRFSTYIKHASEDLARSFRRSGHRADIVIEPADESYLSTVAHLRALDTIDPDLVVLINYFRPQLDSIGAAWLPRNLPFITWIQDDMPHQHDPALPARIVPLDFLAGHITEDFRARLGLPLERTLKTPVVASRAKFHAGSITPAQHERFACDIAFVSHHSETPAAMHARLSAEAGPGAARLVEALRSQLDPVALDPTPEDQLDRLRALVARLVEDHVASAGDRPAITDQLFRFYAIPMTERLLRHQSVSWAAEIARRHGLRLHLYGNGWDTHPELSEFARGPIAHDDDLRACYQAAGLHLHISATTMLHQRLAECALSGGLIACRLIGSALSLGRGAAIRDALLDAPPADPSQPCDFSLLDVPALVSHAAQRQRLGLPVSPALTRSNGVPRERVAMIQRIPPEQRPEWVLGDLAQTTFRTPAELEALALRAARSPRWRTGLSGLIAERSAGLTHDALVPRFIDLVRRGLAPSGSNDGRKP